MKLLHEKYRGDRDAVLTEEGVHFIGPGGRVESEDDHLKRLAQNARMRFNRSIQGLDVEKKTCYNIVFLNNIPKKQYENTHTCVCDYFSC